MFTSSPLLRAALVLLMAAAALPGRADSVASSASSAGSASSASVSDSIGDSSRSSSRDRQVAEGRYRVLEAAQAPGRPGTTRLTLRMDDPVTGPVPEFFLYVPDRALGVRPVAAGDLVMASRRPYGFEFAHADTRRAFFLALHDDWAREMGSHAVTL